MAKISWGSPEAMITSHYKLVFRTLITCIMKFIKKIILIYLCNLCCDSADNIASFIVVFIVIAAS